MNRLSDTPKLERICDYPAYYASETPNKIALSDPHLELTYKELIHILRCSTS